MLGVKNIMRIQTFDTTLRDGTQGEAVSFSVDDKLIIAQKLDELGIDYIEGGWPNSNPKDKEFFKRAQDVKFKHAQLTAFGSTRFSKNSVDQDPNVRALLDAETPTVSIFGKSWDLHVHRALGIDEEQNLKLIGETVKYLKDNGREVVYDAEHFFDGFNANPEFALRTLEAAKKAGADVLCLCDTNGGNLTHRIVEVVSDVRKRFDGVIGIHTHNDCEVAVANTIAAVEAGCTHVQGCINGYGERCGNANIVSIIANLELKLGHTTIGPERLQTLTTVARYIAELANLPMRNDQAYVGHSAFAHKGGVHVSAVLKDSSTYEHVKPEMVGNRQRVLLSDLSGRGNVLYKLKQHGLAERLDSEARRQLLERIKDLEHQGYELEAAEGTFELLVREALHPCVRQCLSNVYPQVKNVRLTDYKVRVLEPKKGTAAKVRVLVEWSDHRRSWATVGVSDNVIEASWGALVDAIRLELMRLTEQDENVDKVVEDYCWGV